MERSDLDLSAIFEVLVLAFIRLMKISYVTIENNRNS